METHLSIRGGRSGMWGCANVPNVRSDEAAFGARVRAGVRKGHKHRMSENRAPSLLPLCHPRCMGRRPCAFRKQAQSDTCRTAICSRGQWQLSTHSCHKQSGCDCGRIRAGPISGSARDRFGRSLAVAHRSVGRSWSGRRAYQADSLAIPSSNQSIAIRAGSDGRACHSRAYRVPPGASATCSETRSRAGS